MMAHSLASENYLIEFWMFLGSLFYRKNWFNIEDWRCWFPSFCDFVSWTFNDFHSFWGNLSFTKCSQECFVVDTVKRLPNFNAPFAVAEGCVLLYGFFDNLYGYIYHVQCPLLSPHWLYWRYALIWCYNLLYAILDSNSSGIADITLYLALLLQAYFKVGIIIVGRLSDGVVSVVNSMEG